MKMPDKEHKQEVQKCKDKLAGSHSCFKESPIYRNGWHYLDLECHPIDSKKFKSTAIEVENKSNKYNRESNYRDLLTWKEKNKEGEIFQITNSEELDVKKLTKSPYSKFSPSFQPKFRRF